MKQAFFFKRLIADWKLKYRRLQKISHILQVSRVIKIDFSWRNNS